MWLGRGLDVARTWLGCGSDVARMWLGCGSGVARTWLGCRSDVFSDVVAKARQKLRERGFHHLGFLSSCKERGRGGVQGGGIIMKGKEARGVVRMGLRRTVLGSSRGPCYQRDLPMQGNYLLISCLLIVC